MFPAEQTLLDILRDGRPVAAATGAQWKTVLHLALREGVSSIVFERLRASAPVVPEPVMTVLARLYHEGAERSATAYAELEEVLRALGAAGIRPMLLKGAALARFTYGDGAARPFTDLDLLVRRDDMAAVDQVMRRAGYAMAGPAHRASTYERCYFTPSWTRLPVDVHWRYAEPFHACELDYGAVFARTSSVTVGGEVALLPSPEDLLLALGIHAMREAWESKPMLRYFYDMAEVIRRTAVDWDRLVRCAHAGRHLRAPLRLGLGAARALLGAAIPARVVEATAPRRAAIVDRMVQRRVRATLLRRPSPFEALLRVAAMRWADGDASPRYAALVGDRVEVQWARLRNHLGRRGERARGPLAR